MRRVVPFDLGPEPGKQADPAEHGPEQGNPLLTLRAQARELDLKGCGIAADGAVDEAGEIAFVAARAERIEHIMVDRLRIHRRRLDIECELRELLPDHRAVAAAALGKPTGDVGPQDQPRRPAKLGGEPVRIARIGHIRGKSQCLGRRQRQLQQLRGRLQAAGEQDHRIARRRALQQSLHRRHAVVAGRIDQDPAGAAEHGDACRFVGQAGGIRLEVGSAEVDPLGIRAQSGTGQAGKRAAARIVGTVEQEEAGPGRRLQRLFDLRPVRLHRPLD